MDTEMTRAEQEIKELEHHIRPIVVPTDLIESSIDDKNLHHKLMMTVQSQRHQNAVELYNMGYRLIREKD